MFLYRTPREYIEGYLDPIVYGLTQLPLYKGGDATADPKLSINRAPTTPLNVPMSFFTGTDDYTLTRRFGTWLDNNAITIKRKDYVNLYETDVVYVEPWASTEYVTFTSINDLGSRHRWCLIPSSH